MFQTFIMLCKLSVDWAVLISSVWNRKEVEPTCDKWRSQLKRNCFARLCVKVEIEWKRLHIRFGISAVDGERRASLTGPA